jgi:hypothetical protein
MGWKICIEREWKGLDYLVGAGIKWARLEYLVGAGIKWVLEYLVGAGVKWDRIFCWSWSQIGLTIWI